MSEKASKGVIERNRRHRLHALYKGSARASRTKVLETSQAWNVSPERQTKEYPNHE